MRDKIIYFLLFILLAFSIDSYACRYTVCEIGYSDFGTDNYKLILFNDSDVNENSVAIFKKTTYAALLDANIESSVINVLQEQESEYIKHYHTFKNGTQALAILVSPDNSVLHFNLVNTEAQFTESVWGLLEDVTSSLARIQIMNSIIQSYAVVLFIEGDSKSANKKALKEINNSVEEITFTQEKMPKPFQNPSEIITLKKDQIKDERVLLWSLGWKEEFSGKPVVAILYGRGRLMGQLLTDDLLQKKYLNNLLTLVGADCECGLDRSWILGRMMPLRWNKKRQQEVVKWRNFDAENPLVKAEMSKILSISPSKERKQGAAGSTTLYGYTESEMKIVDSYSPEQAVEVVVETEENSSSIIYSFYIFGTFALLVLAVGVLLFLRRKN